MPRVYECMGSPEKRKNEFFTGRQFFIPITMLLNGTPGYIMGKQVQRDIVRTKCIKETNCTEMQWYLKEENW